MKSKTLLLLKKYYIYALLQKLEVKERDTERIISKNMIQKS